MNLKNIETINFELQDDGKFQMVTILTSGCDTSATLRGKYSEP